MPPPPHQDILVFMFPYWPHTIARYFGLDQGSSGQKVEYEIVKNVRSFHVTYRSVILYCQIIGLYMS